MNTNLQKLSNALSDAEIEAFFAWSETSLLYLAGLKEHVGHRFMTLGVNRNSEVEFICAALSATQAKRCGLKNIKSWRDGENPLLIFLELANRWNLKEATIAVDEDMPALMLLEMQSALPNAIFKNGGPLLNGLRRTKTQSELDMMRQAAKIADDTYEAIKPMIKAGMTELEVEALLFKEMEARGGHPDFGIVATGPNGAEPHHASDATKIKPGDILVLDFGCSIDGYRSDITRTVAIQHKTTFDDRIYNIVFMAHHEGRLAVKPGASVGAADLAARAVIDEEGFGDLFMHRLGHGIGLQGHEMPYLIPGGRECFQVGDCFSIEPGIYCPDELGVRIENIFVCEESGAVSLNAEPSKELEVVG